MLWSLLKVVIFFVLVGALALGAGQLLNADGSIQVAMANTEFTLGPLQAAIALILLLVAMWVVLKLLGLLFALLRFLNGDETAVSRYMAAGRERKGLNALADSMLALAAGEGKEAQSKAERAEKYLDRPDLTNLLLAQGAEMTGDKARAEEVYKKLVQDDRTRFVGVRGLMLQQLEKGDTDTAFALAEKAFALKPRHVETQDTLLRLQAARHDWSGARQTLGAKLKHGALPRDVHKRRDAVLALSAARDIDDPEQSVRAREAAIEANKLSPDLVPAAVMAAESYIANGQQRYATRVLKKAWEVQPHPDLAATFAAIRPEEKPAQRIKRFGTLSKLKPDHPETRMLLAELHIANEDFPAARRALGDLATAQPTARSVTIMAAIERGEGASDAVVRGWLTRALTVSRGPQWVCENCHTVHSHWDPICGNCGALDTMSWQEPREGAVSLPAQTEMLPLIVGRTEEEPEVIRDTGTPEGSDARPAPQGAAHNAPEKGAAGDGTEAKEAERDMPRNQPTEVPEAEVIVPAEQRDENRGKSAD